MGTTRLKKQLLYAIVVLVASLATFAYAGSAQALTPIPPPDPKPGGFGLQATKVQPPPTQSATITTPGTGASFSDSPITVSGICPTGLLVQIYNNNVMVGAVMCENGSFSVQVSLFVGTNDLRAAVYDELDQAGPDSNTVSVTYTNTNFAAFGELVTLTSSYGRRSAPASTQLTWPLQLSGGTGPYAISIEWGDGTEAQLMSQSLSGVFDIAHIYKRAGIYRVNVRATDANGVTAFLQLVAVSSGEIDAAATTADDVRGAATRVIVIWIPAVIALLLLLPTFWLGRRSQLVSLRNKMLKERDAYQEQ